ncbi:hypothetical protein BRADI_2g08743v3 [Brachypodium distachyon]|uniref:Uncharacterized protein n=1 Tax=Brachypodium distachyon TaxID=15368 RepID=A0A0Q3FVY7_BRADI|nr:hypothetical protein BRADI_2g08743v3 [Brachypodium distachyon]
MYDPREELVLVLAMDFDGRATRIIGPLHGAKYGKYHTDFIPYVSSHTEIYRKNSEKHSASAGLNLRMIKLCFDDRLIL